MSKLEDFISDYNRVQKKFSVARVLEQDFDKRYNITGVFTKVAESGVKTDPFIQKKDIVESYDFDFENNTITYKFYTPNYDGGSEYVRLSLDFVFDTDNAIERAIANEKEKREREELYELSKKYESVNETEQARYVNPPPLSLSKWWLRQVVRNYSPTLT